MTDFWLKGLARRLARDDDDADDLVQESRIAAWRRQPDESRPMRGWLTKVVRDLAGMKRRSDARRSVREAIADSAQAPAGPDELLEQMRLHRLLVDLVLELDEPYRSTIIAHFVEDRTSASIARSLGIPAGTVRKRLWVALSRLRAGLDARSGDRKRWAPAVLAFAQGGMHVAKSTKVVVAVLVLLLLTTIASVVMRVRPGASHDSTTSTSSAGPPPAMIASGAAVMAPDARAPERAAMLEAIARARSHRTAAAGSVTHAASAPSATSVGSADTRLDIEDKTGDTSEWEKRALGTLNSLFGQCFDLGRAEDPALGGTIAVQFTLVGEPNIGGLLERVEILDENTSITQKTFRDCVTQQLYALELDPPPDGVTVEREISLEL